MGTSERRVLVSQMKHQWASREGAQRCQRLGGRAERKRARSPAGGRRHERWAWPGIGDDRVLACGQAPRRDGGDRKEASRTVLCRSDR